MDLITIKNLQDFFNLKNEWNALLDTCEYNSVFLSHEFLYSWWSSFGKNKQLLLLVSYQNEKLVAIAPFFIKKRKVFFLGTPHSDYSDFICKDKIKKDFISKVNLYLKNNKLSHIHLHQISERSITPSILKNLNYKVQEQGKCPTLLIKGYEEEIQKNQLRKKSLKRHFNYFNRNGELNIKHYYSKNEIIKHLDSFFQQHIDRWQGTNSPSLFHKETNKQFYYNLVKNFSETNQLIFSVVTWNKEILAFHFGFQHNNIFTWYKPTYNNSLKHKSPGEVLIKYLLEYAVEHNFTEFDFTRGLEGFKLRFANEIKTNFFATKKRDFFYYKTLFIIYLKKHPNLEGRIKKIFAIFLN